MNTLPSYRRSGRARYQAVGARADASAACGDSEISISARAGSGRRPSKRNHDDPCKKAKLQWQSYEDSRLADLVSRHGAQNWNIIAAELDGRSSKNCRLRWCNQLNPTLNKAPFSAWEDAVVYRGFKTHGTRWALIAKMLHCRTDNSVKNRWNCALRRREELGIHIENDFISSGNSLNHLLAAGTFVRQDHQETTAAPPASNAPSSGRNNPKGDECGWEELSHQDCPCAVTPETPAGSAVDSFLSLCTANMMLATDRRQTLHPAAAVFDDDCTAGGQQWSADEPFGWARTSASADEQVLPLSSSVSSSAVDSFGGWPPSWLITGPALPHPGPAMSAPPPPPPPHDQQPSSMPWPASSELSWGASWVIEATKMKQQFQPQASYCAHSSMDDADDCLHLLFEESSAGLHSGGMRDEPSPAASSYWGHRPPSHPYVQEEQLACAGTVYGPSSMPLEEFYASWGTF